LIYTHYAPPLLPSPPLTPPPTSTLFPYTTLFRSVDEPHPGPVVRYPAVRPNLIFQDREVRRVVSLNFVMAETRRIQGQPGFGHQDRKSTRLNSSHVAISYAVFCLKKKNLRVDATV